MNKRQFERSEQRLKLKDEIYENQVCAEVGQELVKHYPGWDWWVECKIKSGILSVRNTNLDGDYGFVIHLGDYLHNPARQHLIMRAGGEILERYRQERGAMPEVVEGERDVRGNLTGEKDATS